jgi:catechol 2,3-dioxygenase-like lactoylglutathione lyase family enzyme
VGVALAKPDLDVGLFTNQVEKQRAFYGHDLGFEFEGVLSLGPLAPLGEGVDQHRFQVGGSVLKINHCADPLPEAESGYRRVLVAVAGVAQPSLLTDPDGIAVEVVPSGYEGVTSVGVSYAVADPQALDRFLTTGLGAERLGPQRYRLGETVLLVEEDPTWPRSGPIRARGLTYLTVQIRDVVGVHRHLVDLGVEVVTPPTRVGDVAAVCFVRDPAGNWVELAQRAALAGPLPEL